MEKIIKINNERILNIAKDDNSNIRIVEKFYNEGDECAHYSLEQGSNYYFSTNIDIESQMEDVSKALSYEIDNNHPFYLLFLNILGNEDELLINDETKESINTKYFLIKKDGNNISLNFINKCKQSDEEKFSVIFKKENDKKEKRKINCFFNQVDELFLKNNYPFCYNNTKKEEKKLQKVRVS